MKKYQIGIMGSWRMNLPKSSYKIAEVIGAEIAKRGHILITGGTSGISEYARKGNQKNKGINISLIPQLKNTYGYIGKYVDIIISTGFTEEGRIPIMINSCDAIIVANKARKINGTYKIGDSCLIIPKSIRFVSGFPAMNTPCPR